VGDRETHPDPHPRPPNRPRPDDQPAGQPTDLPDENRAARTPAQRRGSPSTGDPGAPVQSGRSAAGSATPARPDPADTRRSILARLLVLAPLALGVLLVEGIFAARGERGDLISLPAAGVAVILLWMGTAWALRSWFVLLLTFLPAMMLTLGAAMVGDVAPGGGAVLLVIGALLLTAVASFRLSGRQHPRTFGPPTAADSAEAPWPGSLPSEGPRPGGAWPGSAWPGGAWPGSAWPGGATGSVWPDPPIAPARPGAEPGRPGSRPGAAGFRPGGDRARRGPAQPWPGLLGAGSGTPDGPLPRFPFRPLDPLGAHFLGGPPPPGAGKPLPTGGSVELPSPPHDRPAPDWDTSGTDRGARDRFVARLRERGGASAPTLAGLEEFFAGNGDPRSIAPSLRGAVPLSTFRMVLHRIRANPAVSELLVQVEPLEPGRYPAGEWPVAGSLHLITTLSAAEIDALAADVHPEPAIGPLPAAELADGTPAPPGSGELAIWWE
jgi:hypothetical protein